MRKAQSCTTSSKLWNPRAEGGAEAGDGAGNMSTPMLSNAADDKMDDGFGQVITTILVDSTVVRPKPDKLKHAKEDANDIHSGLHTMFSLNEAQKFQAIQGEGVKETSPDPADRVAVDGVGDTVVVPAADVAVRVFSEPTLCESSVKPKPEQADQNPGGDKRSDRSEVPGPTLHLSLFSLPLQL